jgi:hypothetical protein
VTSPLSRPVGAVSTTTNDRRDSLITRENAWKTATSSVQGESKSSVSVARPCWSSLAPLAPILALNYSAVRCPR